MQKQQFEGRAHNGRDPWGREQALGAGALEDPEGWDRERGGRGDRDGEHM